MSLSRRPSSEFAAAAALWLAAAVSLPAREAVGSPASLRAELARFEASPQSSGLSFCAIFLPLDEPPGAPAEPPGKSALVWLGADRLLVPASLAKLAATVFALDVLGPDFTFRTQILRAGEMRGDTLHGDLVVRGGGDPFLVSERLWMLSRELRATGLRRVEGALRIDDSWIAPDSVDPVRARDREVSDRPYAAKLTALAVNFNAAEIRIRPAAVEGAPAVVEAAPFPCGYLRVDNRLSTVSAAATESWSVTPEPDSAGEVVRVEGTVRLDTAPFAEYRSVRDPRAYSASLLRAALEDAGITFAEGIAFGPGPDDAVLLHEHSSLPLRDLVDSANRYSNNFMADQIALALSTVADSADIGRRDSAAAHPASLTEAGNLITRRLRREFGAGPSVRQMDGSGLNPGSQLTGGVLARVLAWAWGDLRIGPELAASLPLPGGDGTLRRRFQNGEPAVLRAKTGTMSTPPASGMAGYMDGPGTAPTVFVLLMNGEEPAWDLSRMKALQEAWVREYTRE